MAIDNEPWRSHGLRTIRTASLFCLLSCGMLAVLASPALSQNAVVTGEVSDSSGAKVPDAKVTLTSNLTKVAQRTTTNNAGLYSLSVVQAGEYSLTIEANGFARFEQAAIPIKAAQQLTFNAALKLENASQSITVREANQPLEQAPMVGKTGTKLEDLPSSVTIINRDLVDIQGGIALKDTLRNASGIGQGGSDSFGFGDRFLIRGLDARIYNDGFSDGDQRNGIPHSLNGVEHVEVLEGPGSSLFGSGPPGGTINVVHYAPSPTFDYGGRFETGSFGTVSGSAYVTGSTGIQGLDYRVDALAQHSEGFRSLKSGSYEFRPELSWALGHHFLTFAIDARDLQATPDPAGLIYIHGLPIQGVSREAKYSTPFSHGNQTLLRTTLSDSWSVAPYLTITNRFSYIYRNLLILRNGDGGTVTGTVLSGRQLRAQHDILNDFDYQFEPVWTLRTGRIKHTVLTGFELQHQSIYTNRATADLPNITNIYDPIIPETSTTGLNFLRDASHSGDIDNLSATYFSTYVADQIDLTDRLKIRLSGRKDWWDTDLTPQIFVPGRIYQGNQIFQPGVNYGRNDAPLSGSVGILYKLLPGLAPFVGISRSNLATFSSESTTNGIHAPESALQYEAGLKLSEFKDRVTLTAAAFDIKRNNVFTLVGDVPFFNNQATRGIDANLQLRLFSGWRLMANATGQHAVLTSNPSSPSSTGKAPVGVPAKIFNLWTSYDFRIASVSGFRLSGGVNYRDKLYGNTLNTNLAPAFTTMDAVVSYAPREWAISVGCRNLTDTTYFVAANGAGAFLGEPRSIFVEFKTTFRRK